MLKKLLKYEWKAVWKVLVIINAFTVVSTLIGMVVVKSADTWHIAGRSMPMVILFMLYYMTIIGVSFAMSVYMAIRFYRNLYTDEGYLMHTLPVTKRQLVLSKLLVHALCQFITQVLLLISVILLLFPLFAEVLDMPYLFLNHIVPDLLEMLDSAGISVSAMVLLSLISNVAGLFSGTLTMYCAIVLGQTFHRHKVMGSILCYIGFYCMTQTFTSMLIIPQTFYIGTVDFNPMSYMSHILTSVSIFCLFSGIVYYCITMYMMNKKLNLD